MIRQFKPAPSHLKCWRIKIEPDVGKVGYHYAQAVMVSIFISEIMSAGVDILNLPAIMSLLTVEVATGETEVDILCQEIAAYRGVPYAGIGTRIYTDYLGWGVIAGGNASANFNAIFDRDMARSAYANVHPNSKIEYYSPEGELLGKFVEGDSYATQPKGGKRN